MNKNGIVAVVVVVTAVVLIGLWVMRSGQSRPGGRQFDCAAPPNAPVGLVVTKNGKEATGAWTAPGGNEAPTTYVLEGGSQPGLNDQGTYVLPATQLSFTREILPGTYFVRVFARNACGTSPASNEVTLVMP
jgi:hypothetical protein